MMTDDVAGLREEFRAMYAVAGTDAKAAAEESKGFLNELAKLKTLSGMLAKAVGLAFIGKIRRDIENLRRVIMENFGKIQRILQIVIGFVMRVAGAIGAFVYRIIKWAGQLVGWFDSLDDGQKKLVIGVGLLIAAWKMLNLAFLTTPLGMLITGLAGIVALVDDYLTYMEGGESYFDWGPWAGTIERCVSVLKDVWNVIYAVGAAIGSALGPAFAMIVEQLAWLSRTIGYVAHILYQVFTGDLSGALETAKTMLADWGETGQTARGAFMPDYRKIFFKTVGRRRRRLPRFRQMGRRRGRIHQEGLQSRNQSGQRKAQRAHRYAPGLGA